MPKAIGSLYNCYRVTVNGNELKGYFKYATDAEDMLELMYPNAWKLGDFKIEPWFIEGEF